MKNYFICGMPRAGTTYISALLNKHSQIISTGESLFFGRMFEEPNSDGNYSKVEINKILDRLSKLQFDNIDENRKHALKINIIKEFETLGDNSSPRKVFDAISKAFLNNSDQKNIFVEKTPHHCQYINRILRHYPETKFILLIRNPYEWLLSYKFQGSQKNEEVRKIFKRIYHPLFSSLVWRKNYLAINRGLASYPKKCFVIKNEDLKNYSMNHKIQSFINVPYEDLKLDRVNSSFAKINKPKLDPIDVFWMNFVAKKHIAQSSYEFESVKINPLMFLKSVFQIIPSAFYIVKYLPSNKNIFLYLINYLKK